MNIREKLGLSQKNLVLIILAAGFLLALAACLALYLLFCMPRPAPVDALVPDTEGVVRFGIDAISQNSQAVDFNRVGRRHHMTLRQEGYSNHYLTVAGWAYIPGQPIVTANAGYLLQDTQTGEYIALRTYLMDYDHTGMMSLEDAEKQYTGLYGVAHRAFLTGGREYRLYISYTNNGNNLLVDTGEVFTLGEGYNEYAELDG